MSQQTSLNFQTYIANLLIEIENKLGIYTIGKPQLPLPVLSFTDLSKVDSLLTDTENNINNTLSSKIFTAVNTLNSSIIGSRDTIVNKLVNATQGITSSINNLKNDLKWSIEFQVNDIERSITNLNSNIALKLAAQTTELKSAITQSQTSVQNTIIGQLGSFSKEIDEQTLIQDKRLQQIAVAIAANNQELVEGLSNLLLNNLTDENKNDIYELSQRIINYMDDKNQETLNQVLNKIIEDNFGAFLDTGTIKNIFDVFSSTANIASKIISGVNPVSAVSNLFSGVIGQFALGVIAYIITDTIISPFAQHIVNASMSVSLPSVPTVEQLIRLEKLKVIPTDKYLELMRYLGHNLENALNLLNLGDNYLNESEIQQLWLRDLKTEDEINKHLLDIGVRPEDFYMKKQIWRAIPHVSDIIRMQVREAFTQSAVDEFGLDEDYNPIVEKYAEQAGLAHNIDELDVSWTQMFWRAHWQLPSVTQAFEMFQRDVISREQLEKLLISQDIVPKWRDYLLQISYNPLGRIDIRRFHAMGKISDEELVTFYRHQGYSPEMSQLAAEWTIDYNANSTSVEDNPERILSLTQIIRYLKLNRITRENAISRMIELGYTNETASLIIDSELAELELSQIPEKLRNNFRKIEQSVGLGFIRGHYSETDTRNRLAELGFSGQDINDEIRFLNIERDIELKQIVLDSLKERYTQNLLTNSEVRSALAFHGFSPQEVERIITMWNIIINSNSRLPSVNDLQAWLKSGIIDRDFFYKYMNAHGYDDIFINNYYFEIVRPQ